MSRVSARTWVGRLALIGWLALGLVAMLASPKPGPMSPTLAEEVFGQARSVQSSAPSGLFAFGKVLERLGFEVSIHVSAGAPEADVLVILSPQLPIDAEEKDALMDWIGGGGRLIYAPTPVELEIVTEPEAAAAPADASAEAEDEGAIAPEAHYIFVEDALLETIEQHGTKLPSRGGAARLWRVGSGVVALLKDGGRVLSNEALAAEGITGELGWLREVLARVRHIAFDEVRIGAAADQGLVDLISRSRFRSAVLIGLLALGIYLVARSVRPTPPQPAITSRERDFGEHLDAVASLLQGDARSAVTAQLLAEGTRRRLGALATSDAARSILGTPATQRKKPSPAELARYAERLRRLECDLTRSTR